MPKISHRAFLVNLDGLHLPPFLLPVSARYQVCVDAGVLAAIAFLDEFQSVNMHDHMANSVFEFTKVARSGLSQCGDSSPERLNGCIDAFAAGYLGRLHQEFMRLHGSGENLRPPSCTPSPQDSSKFH